eukprot:2422045-Pyramimonas_sp.AAC.1
MVLGDFNFAIDAPMYLQVSLVDKGVHVQPRQREHGSSWWQSLSELVELDPERPTHYMADEQRLSALDKIF